MFYTVRGVKMGEENKQIYFVCGGGHQGLAMAAHLALNGEKVTLWNRTPEHIDEIMRTGRIYCSGEVNGIAKIEKASDNIEEVVTSYILVTVPSTAYHDVAQVLAPYVNRNTVIVLNPGRTFGAIEFSEELKKNGVKEMPQIAETQTIVYTCRRSDKNCVTIFAMKRDVEIAALDRMYLNNILRKMPVCLQKYFVAQKSVAYTSFANVGMILHCAPVLMNIGWIENEKVDFKYYYDGISKSVAKYIEKMDAERINVAKELGYKIESVSEWLRRTYNVEGTDLYECIKNNIAYREIDAPPSLDSRYIYEDVPNGLVPIEYIGKQLNVETKYITNIIDLANGVYDADFRKTGRQFPVQTITQYF